ncbi:hypothetical protein ACTFIV_000804 [Dictyostelium citrinum]
MNKNFINSNISILKLYIFLFLFNKINCSDDLENSIYVIKQWQFENCTGQQYEFFSFKQSKFYSDLLNAQFQCNYNQSNVYCEIDFISKKLNISSSSCNNGKTLEYLQNFDIENKQYNVISEFKDDYCNTSPVFNLGILDNHCVYGIFIKSLFNGYEVQKCESLDFNNATNYTIIDENRNDPFLIYDCKEPYFLQKDLSSTRYMVHKYSLDNINIGNDFSNSSIISFNLLLIFSLIGFLFIHNFF